MSSIYSLDIDGNGVIEATKDGVLLLRYLKGAQGEELIRNAVGTSAPRSDAIEIKEYLDKAVRNGGFDADEDGFATENDGHLIFVYLLNRDKNGTVDIDELDASYTDLGIDKKGLTTQEISDNITAMLISDSLNPTEELEFPYPTPGKDTEFNENFIYDRNSLSDKNFFKYFAFEGGNAKVGAPYPGTIIYEEDYFGGNRVVKQTTTPSDTSKPYSGTISLTSNKVYYGTNPIHLSIPGQHDKVAPFKMQGRKFGYANARPTSDANFYILALENGTTISIYEDAKNPGGGGFSGSRDDKVSLNAGEKRRKTVTNIPQNQWTFLKSNKPVLVTVEQQHGGGKDRMVLAPARSYVYRGTNNGRKITENGAQSLSIITQKDYVLYNNANSDLLWAQMGADGDGNDAAAGLGLNELSKNFAWGNKLRDYIIVAPRKNTVVRVSYWNGTAWVLLEEHNMGTSSVTNPARVSRVATGTNFNDFTLWKFESSEEIMLQVNDSAADEEQVIGWSDENFGAEIKPTYGSSISFKAQNSTWYGGEYNQHTSPLGLNSLKANINLSFVGSSEDISPVVSILESLSSKTLTGDIAASGGLECLNFGDFVGSNFISLDTDYYNNFSGSLLESFSMTDLSDDTYRVDVKLFNDSVSPFLANGNGFIKNHSVAGASGDYKKFDIITSSANASEFDNYFYCSKDTNYKGLSAPLSGLSTYTGNFENFTRTFFFEPDQQTEVSFDQSNEILKLKGSRSSKNTLSNNKNYIKSLNLNFTNRTQKETVCILHFLESHLGYKTFYYNYNNNLITKNKIFICEEWEHTFNYKDSNNIRVVLKEVPSPENIFFDNTIVPKGSFRPVFRLQSNQNIFGNVDIILTNASDLTLALEAYQWQVTSDGINFENSIFKDANKSRYMVKPEEAGSGIRGIATVFDQQGEEFTFTSDVVNIENFNIEGSPVAGSELNISNRGVGISEDSIESVVAGDLNIQYNNSSTTYASAVSNIQDLQEIFLLNTGDDSEKNFLTAVDPTGLTDYGGFFVWRRKRNANTFLSQSAETSFTTIQQTGKSDSDPFNFAEQLTGNAANYTIKDEDENSTIECVAMSFFKSSTDLGDPRIEYIHDDLSNPGNKITGYLYAFTGSAETSVAFVNSAQAQFSVVKGEDSVPAYKYFMLSGSNLNNSESIDKMAIADWRISAGEVSYPTQNLTSNTSLAGTEVSAGYTHVQDTYAPWKAFDSTTTWWWTLNIQDGSLNWLKLELPSAIQATGMSLIVRAGSDFHTVDKIHILASNDENFSTYETWGIVQESVVGGQNLQAGVFSSFTSMEPGVNLKRGIKYTVNDLTAPQEESILVQNSELIADGDTLEVKMILRDPDGLATVGSDYDFDTSNHTITWLTGLGDEPASFPNSTTLVYDQNAYGPTISAQIAYTDGKGFSENVTASPASTRARTAFTFLVDTSKPIDYYGAFFQSNEATDKEISPFFDLARFPLVREPAHGGYEHSAFHILSGHYDLDEPLIVTIPVVIGGNNTINDVGASIDWGDGGTAERLNPVSISSYEKVSFQNEINQNLDMFLVRHAYSSEGIYQIGIDGDLPIHFKYVETLIDAILENEIPSPLINYPSLWADQLSSSSKFFASVTNLDEVVVPNYGNRILEISDFGGGGFNFKNHRSDSNPIQNLNALRKVPNLNTWSEESLNASELFNNCFDLRELEGVPFSGKASNLSYYKNCHNLSKYTINASGENRNLTLFDFSTVGSNKATNRVFEIDVVDLDKCRSLSADALVADPDRQPNTFFADYRAGGNSDAQSAHHSTAGLSLKKYYEIASKLLDVKLNGENKNQFPVGWFLGDAENINNEFGTEDANLNIDASNSTLYSNYEIHSALNSSLSNNLALQNVISNPSIAQKNTYEFITDIDANVGFDYYVDLTTNTNGFEQINDGAQNFDLGFDCVYEDRLNGGLSATPNIYKSTASDTRHQTFNMLVLYSALFNLNHKFKVEGPDNLSPFNSTEMGVGDLAQHYLAFPNQRDMGELRREISSYDSIESGDLNFKNVLKTNEQVFKVKDYLDFNSEVVSENILSSVNGEATVKRITKYSWKVKEVFETGDPHFYDGSYANNYYTVRYGPSFDGVNYEYIKYEGEKVSKGLLVNNVRQIPTGQFGHNLGGFDHALQIMSLDINGGKRLIIHPRYSHNYLNDPELDYSDNTTLNPGLSTITPSRYFYPPGYRYGGHGFDNLTFPMSGLATPNIDFQPLEANPDFGDGSMRRAEKNPIKEEINYHFKNLMSDGYFKSYRDLTNPNMSGLFNPDDGGSVTRTADQSRPISNYYRYWEYIMPGMYMTSPTYGDMIGLEFRLGQNLFSVNSRIGSWGSIFGGALGEDPSYGNEVFNAVATKTYGPADYSPGPANTKYLGTFRNHQSFINESNFDDYYKVEVVKVSEALYNQGTDPFSATLTKDDFEYKETNLFKGIYLSGLEMTDDGAAKNIEFTPIFNQTYSTFSHRAQFHYEETSWGNELDGSSYYEIGGYHMAYNSNPFDGFENR